MPLVFGGQGLVFGDRAADRRHAGRSIVDVGHRSHVGAGKALCAALTIDVVDADLDQVADVGIAENIGGSSRTRDVVPGHAAVGGTGPLVAEAAQAVDIADAAGVGGEGLIFRHRPDDDDRTGWLVVDVGHRPDTRAGQALGAALSVGVGDTDLNQRIHVGIAERVGRCRGSDDRAPGGARHRWSAPTDR